MNNFIIYNDDVLEDDEVFLGTFTIPALVSARKGEPSRTNIVIRSDDGKSHVVQSSLVHKCLCPLLFSCDCQLQQCKLHSV